MFTTSKSAAKNSLSILVYGKSGIGKTTLAATTPDIKKTVVISLENGTRSIADKDIAVYDVTVDANGNDLDRPTRHDKFLHALKIFNTDEIKAKYDYVIVDSLSEISQNLVEKLKGVYPDKKDSMKLWGDYNDQMLHIVKTIRDIKSYAVVVLALEKVDKDEFNRRFYGVDIAGKISDRLPAFFDEVFYYNQFDINDKKERMFLTSVYETYTAKDRSGKLDLFEKPSLKDVIAKINK